MNSKNLFSPDYWTLISILAGAKLEFQKRTGHKADTLTVRDDYRFPGFDDRGQPAEILGLKVVRDAGRAVNSFLIECRSRDNYGCITHHGETVTVPSPLTPTEPTS